MAAPVWYFAWYICSSILVLNFLLAAVISSFSWVKDRARRQERVEREALEGGVRLPPALESWLTRNLPVALLWGGGKDKAAQEARENLAELGETLCEVDLEALWARLLQGVLDNEAAVDAVELGFLFGGSQKKARHFVNRVCNLAGLRRVEVPDETPTLELIDDTEVAIARLAVEVSNCCGDLKELHPSLCPQSRPDCHEKMLSAARPMEAVGPCGIAGEGEGDGVGRPGGKVLLLQNAVREGNQVFADGVRPPERGDLHIAAAALDARRRHMVATREGPDTGALDDDEALAEDELAHGRRAIASFTDAPPLQRL